MCCSLPCSGFGCNVTVFTLSQPSRACADLCLNTCCTTSDLLHGLYASCCFQAANNGFGFAGWAEALAGCLTNLEDLRAGGTNATDFDLLALRPLTKLTALDLSDSPEVSR